MAEHPADDESSLARSPRGVPPELARRFPATYARLRSIAATILHDERTDHTLEATALVHEAFLRLSENNRTFSSDDEFVAVAAAQMRHVLVDHARRAKALKRGGAHRPASLDTSALGVPASAGRSVDLLDLDELLCRLETLEPRQARLVEMHLFGSLPIERAATLLGIAERTAFNDWRMARAWLLSQLTG